jgi:hypothetical protein
LPIGSTGADPVLASLTGTANQLTVTNGAGTITLATPQDTHTSATPTFAALTLSGSATYGIDLSGGTWSSGVMNWDADPDVYANGSLIIKADVTNENFFFGSNNATNAGQYNFLLGAYAGANVNGSGGGVEGTRCVFIGSSAGRGDSGSDLTGNSLVCIGSSAGRDLVSATNAVAMGTNSARLKQSGADWFALGGGAAETDVSSGRFVAIGGLALSDGTSIDDCIAIGRVALEKRNNAQCIGIGTDSGRYGTSGSRSIYIGLGCGRGVNGGTSGDYRNTVVGTFAFQDVTTAIENSLYGYFSGGDITTANRAIFLGAFSGRYQTTADDVLLINNRDRGNAANELTHSIIYGVMAANPESQSLTFNVDTLTVGTDADADVTMTFQANTNDGVLKWMEDEDYFEFGDDVTFADGAGLFHGSCYGNDIGWSQANAVQNTWYNISDADMADGVLNGVTHDGSGELTVTYAGMYLVNYSLSFEDDTVNDHIEVGIEVSGSGSANAAGQNHTESKFANEEEGIGGTCILDLAASATIEVAIRTTDNNTPTISVQHVNLTCVLVGGT